MPIPADEPTDETARVCAILERIAMIEEQLRALMVGKNTILALIAESQVSRTEPRVPTLRHVCPE